MPAEVLFLAMLQFTVRNRPTWRIQLFLVTRSYDPVEHATQTALVAEDGVLRRLDVLLFGYAAPGNLPPRFMRNDAPIGPLGPAVALTERMDHVQVVEVDGQPGNEPFPVHSPKPVVLPENLLVVPDGRAEGDDGLEQWSATFTHVHRPQLPRPLIHILEQGLVHLLDLPESAVDLRRVLHELVHSQEHQIVFPAFQILPSGRLNLVSEHVGALCKIGIVRRAHLRAPVRNGIWSA